MSDIGTRIELVEVMAFGIGQGSAECSGWWGAADDALVALESAGLAVVPVEPTEKMGLAAEHFGHPLNDAIISLRKGIAASPFRPKP